MYRTFLCKEIRRLECHREKLTLNEHLGMFKSFKNIFLTSSSILNAIERCANEAERVSRCCEALVVGKQVLFPCNNEPRALRIMTMLLYNAPSCVFTFSLIRPLRLGSCDDACSNCWFVSREPRSEHESQGYRTPSVLLV